MMSTGQVVPAITPVRRLSSLNCEKLHKENGNKGRHPVERAGSC